MRSFFIRPAAALKANIGLPGDKAIAHRALIISSLAKGRTIIENFPLNKDCLFTLRALKKLGPEITLDKKQLRVAVQGRGLLGFQRPKAALFVGDSGTTLRLLLGLLAGQDFSVCLKAGSSLSHRPMRRVIAPLRLMGAQIKSRSQSPAEEYAPLLIRGGRLKPIAYKMPVASAQVKSAILLAGLFASGKTKVVEPLSTRDHTERMLISFGAAIKSRRGEITIEPGRQLCSPGKIYIPGDISSASFFMVLGSLLKGSEITLNKVGLNPSRAGIIRVLRRMGASLKITSRVTANEPYGNLTVKSSILKAVCVKKNEIPALIDELPVLMVAASLAKGRSVFAGVEELRVKETDRINSMKQNLKKMGADIAVFRYGNSEAIVIKGRPWLKGAQLKSFGDHRTAMSMVIAGLLAKGNSRLDEVSCINKSFPDFLKVISNLTSSR